MFTKSARLKIILALLLAITIVNVGFAQFSKVTGAKGLGNTASGNMNGHAWGDLNNDGYLDVIFHYGSGGSSASGKLFINDGPPNYTFTDRTSTLINGFSTSNNYGRQMLIVDFNNDGYNDVLRGFGSSRNTEIYYNDGPPNYTFGDGSQNPDFEIGTPLDGQEWNTEGIVAVDWNQDGWLDVIIDNDAGSTDVWENDQSGGFTYVSPGTSTGQTGFAASHSGDGDFMTAADIDDDGYVDLYARKTAVTNYWWYNPVTSRFETQANPNIVSNESDKGGTMFCDFDGDGDLDLFWTSHGNNEIWRNDGSNVWTATGIPAAPIRTQSDIDGCDCGDVDNDGDIDIFLGAASGNSYLLINNTPIGGALSFSSSNIAVNANTESTTFTDFDGDGDLDLYAVINGAANQLWENTTNDNNFLYVNAKYDNGNGSSRYAIGANILLSSCSGDTLSLKQVNGGKGHGSQHQNKVHFGVDPYETYVVEVHYVYENGERKYVKRAVRPIDEPSQEITILNTDYDNVMACHDKDNDGITDFEDMDDDNDGILDSDEFLICGAADWTSNGYTISNTDLQPAITGAGQLGTATVDFIGNTVGTPSISFMQVNNGLGGNSGEGLFFRGSQSTGLDDAMAWTFDFSTTVYNVDLNFGSVDNADEIHVHAFYQGTEIRIDTNNLSIWDYDNLFYKNPNIVYAPSNGSGSENVFDEAFNFKLAGPVDSLVFYAFKNNGSTANVTLWVSDFAYCLPNDTDGDGIADHMDLDSDNDGIPDLVEAGGVDTDGDGLIDNTTDTDNNGVIDIYDISNGGDAITNEDTDGDGIKDYLDLDSDNDGIPDVIEAGGTDSNGDGIADNYIDTDEDGFNDAIDGDVGNNGVENTSNALQITGTDTDSDGIPDSYSVGDTDSDGVLDRLDLDSDNDGVPDLVEVGGADTNGDGYVDNYDPGTGLFSGSGDSEGDGFSNYYDSDTDNNGTTGDSGTDPMILTSTDSNNDGDPDNGFIEGDFDGDYKPNHLDLDADDDGITDVNEAGVTDTDGDGIADDALTNDSDGNGWSNSYDGNNSGTTPVTTTDSGADGYPDAYTSQNEDSDIHPNFLDIDSDNDGIVDNTEGQSTATYTAPDANDTDGDGIDDAYDNISGFGGAGIDAENTDWIDNPDYLDTDSDNDGEADSIEGHDTNGDGTIDGSDSPVARNGVSGGTADIDGDGLLDGFDNDLSSTISTNTNLEPSSHPDVDQVGVDQDWRQSDCSICRMQYAIQDGTNTQTTNHIYNSTTGLLEATSLTYGAIRTNRYCLIDGWRYYYNPADPSEALFAIKGDATELDKIEYLEIQVGQNSENREAGTTDIAYSRLMNRDWAVELSSALTKAVDIRFYYSGLDFGTNGFQKADTNADGYNLTGVISTEWFAVTDWGLFDPTTINADGSNLTGLLGYSVINPVVNANTSTGDSETDGTASTVGNAKNFIQFNGLLTIDGGSVLWSTDISALPVELSYFRGEANGCNVQLTWSSETEESFSHYELERSGNGESFRTIERVNAEGGTFSQTYQLTDREALIHNFYRLKMVDLDGSYEYSEITHVETECGSDQKMTIYPNPVAKPNSRIFVKFYTNDTDAPLILTNVAGQILQQITLGTQTGWNTLQLDLSGLPSGTYFIKLLGQRNVERFVIQE